MAKDLKEKRGLLAKVSVIGTDGVGNVAISTSFVKGYQLKITMGFHEPEEFFVCLPKKASRPEVAAELRRLADMLEPEKYSLDLNKRESRQAVSAELKRIAELIGR